MKVNQITVQYEDGNTITAMRESNEWQLDASDFGALITTGPQQEGEAGRKFDERDLLFELACALGSSHGDVQRP